MRRGAFALLASLAAAGPLASQVPGVLSGRVVSAATGAPVAGAEVTCVGSAARVLTDSAGAFSLRVGVGVGSGSGGGGDGVASRVRVRRLGFAVRETDARAGAVIALEPLPISLDAVVVSAARREQRLKDAVPEIALLTRRDIERSGASDAASVLTQATGAQLEGGVPSGAGVFLQGMGSQRVLILIDGQPVVGRLNGNFDLSRLPASAIERIEVVRGPQSTLYGSAAMGGVVNIITRAPTPSDAASLSVTGGTQGRRDLSGTVSGTRGDIGVALDAGARVESLAPGLAGDDDTYARRWNVAPSLRWSLRPGTSLRASALVVGETQRYRTGQLFHFSDNTQLAGQVSMTWLDGARRFTPALSFSRFDHLSRAGTGTQPASDSGQRDVQDVVQFELTGSTALFGALADAGLVARHDAIKADRVDGAARSLDGVEGYAQGTWAVAGVTLSPGVRVSSSRQWGTAVTPRLAALVRPLPELAVRASVGTAYRAPDFKELYLNFVNAAAGYAVVGNPSLRPERSTSASLGVEWVGSAFFGRASVFLNRFRDFIDYGPPDATGTYTYLNVGRGVTRGLESEIGWAVDRTRLEAGYAFLDALDEASGSPLLGRARHTGRLSASSAVGDVQFGATIQVTGRAPGSRDSLGTITEWRAAYTRFDLRASLRVGRSVSLRAGIDNVLDQAAGPTWPGFTGRRLFAGVSWQSGVARRD